MAGGTGSLEARRRKNFIKYVICSVSTLAVVTYVLGVSDNSYKISLLRKEKSKLVQKIETMQGYIPMLQESFAKSYADSLKQLRGERNELSQRIAEEDSRIFYSWTNYLR